MNDNEKLIRYIVSEALKALVGEVSATGGASTGGGDTFAVTPGEGYVTPNAFRGKKKKKEAIKEAEEDTSATDKDIQSLATKSPSPGQVPAGYSGDIQAMKKNLGITPQTKVVSTKRGGRNNPYALAHWMKKKGIAPAHAPIPAHEPTEKLPGELDRATTLGREARLRAAADARRAALGHAKRGPKPKPRAPEQEALTRATPDELKKPEKPFKSREYYSDMYRLPKSEFDKKYRGGVPQMPVGTTEGVIEEKAPPGMEDTVMALKKKYPGDHAKAFKIAWSQYNKKNETVSDFHKVECPKCHGSGCEMCSNSGEVSQPTASKWRDSQKNEGIILLKNLVEDKTDDDAEKSLKSKVKYKTKGDNSPVIIINPPEKTEEAIRSFGINSRGENDVIGGGSTVGGMEAAVGAKNGRANEAGGYTQGGTRAALDKLNQRTPGHPDFRGPAPTKNGVTDYSPRPLKKQPDAANPQKNEVAPEGWEKTVKAMKKHKDIDNPWALANYMKNKGDTPHK